MARDGDEAIKIFKTLAKRPDAIIMDYSMPKVDGLVAMKEILGIDPSAKIIFLSADFSVKDQAILAGSVGFLEKPVEFGDLIKKLDRIG